MPNGVPTADVIQSWTRWTPLKAGQPRVSEGEGGSLKTENCADGPCPRGSNAPFQPTPRPRLTGNNGSLADPTLPTLTQVLPKEVRKGERAPAVGRLWALRHPLWSPCSPSAFENRQDPEGHRCAESVSGRGEGGALLPGAGVCVWVSPNRNPESPPDR